MNSPSQPPTSGESVSLPSEKVPCAAPAAGDVARRAVGAGAGDARRTDALVDVGPLFEQQHRAAVAAHQLAGAVVFGVFAEISLAPRRGDPLSEFGHLDRLHVGEFRFKLVIAGAGHRDQVGHNFLKTNWRKKTRSPQPLGDRCRILTERAKRVKSFSCPLVESDSPATRK